MPYKRSQECGKTKFHIRFERLVWILWAWPKIMITNMHKYLGVWWFTKSLSLLWLKLVLTCKIILVGYVHRSFWFSFSRILKAIPLQPCYCTLKRRWRSDVTKIFSFQNILIILFITFNKLFFIRIVNSILISVNSR